MQTKTADQIAAQLVAFAGAGIKPDVVEARYRSAADDMRKVAAKAAASRSGKFRGYTAEHATRMAEQNDRLASEVPDAIRRLLSA